MCECEGMERKDSSIFYTSQLKSIIGEALPPLLPQNGPSILGAPQGDLWTWDEGAT